MDQGKSATFGETLEEEPMPVKSKVVCPTDAKHHVQSRGPQIYCYDCPGWYTKEFSGEKSDSELGWKFDATDEKAIVQAGTDEVVRNLEDLIRVCKIDTKMWEVDRYTVGVNSAYRKDRKGVWQVDGGVVQHGDIEDTGRILRAPLYNVKAWLVRKTEEIRKTSALEDLKMDIRQMTVKMPKLKKHVPDPEGLIYEIDMPDLHFGKLTWGEESGGDYDIKIAEDMAMKVFEELLANIEGWGVSQILLPWGNDFFNVDTIGETTTGGTPQQEDTRWRKTFREGRRLTQKLILLCSQVAPVDVLFMPGNHDTARLYYLGETISAAFENNPNISVDNSPRSRKYRHYNKVLLGFAHGSVEKLEKLPTTMSIEAKQAWAVADYREWHLGDKHTRKQFDLRHEEQLACTIRLLSSLSGTDTWHFDNQFVGNIKAASSFLWHPEQGLKAEFHALGN